MSTVLKFLNDNAGAFNLLFTAVVAVATVVYAVLTARLVRETQRLREVATEPAIEVTYRARDEAMALLEIVVKNIGSGPAYRVEFECSASPSSSGADELLNRLKKIRFLASGINMLLPGQEYTSYWTDARKNTTEKMGTQILVKTKCRGATGVEYVREHIVEFSELDGVERLGTPAPLAIARSLEKLQKDVEHLASGFRRLRVDAYTQADREREPAEWEAYKAEFRQSQREEQAINSAQARDG
jgi:hypothetical protein